MGKSNPAKLSFNGGVQSPLLRGMVNAPKGDSSFQASNNMVPMKYGPIARRGASELVVQTNTFGGDGKKIQLVDFQYNDTQAYVLAFSYNAGVGSLSVYKDKAVILNSSVSTSISNISTGSPFTMTVADSSGFALTDDVVMTITSPANSELDGRIAGVSLIPTGTSIKVDPRFLPFHQAGATTGTLDAIYKIAIPYDGDDMFASDGTFRLDVRQHNDVMYIAHPDYQTRILTRAGDDDWSISIMQYKEGPYLPDNVEKQKRLDCSNWYTLTDGAGDIIEDYRYCTVTTRLGDFQDNEETFDLFSASDVQATDDHGVQSTRGTSTEGGRQFSLFASRTKTGLDDDNGSNFRWHFLRIVKFISATEAVMERKKGDRDWGNKEGRPRYYTTSGGNIDRGVYEWALGSFSDSTGYPSVVEIHDGRLSLGNTLAEPTTVHFSQIGGFDTTSSTWQTVDFDGQVYDDLGFNVGIGGGNQSPIQWISSSSDGVLVGSYNSEGLIGANDTSNGFVPGGVSFRKTSSVGSKSIQPIMIDQSTLFVSRTGRRIHEMTYDLASTGQKSPDLTSLAEHVTRTGIIDFAWQREPRDTLWLVLNDGKLVGFTFDKNNDITAWHQHTLGGEDDSDYASGLGVGDSFVRSVAVIPSADGLSDELWLAVDREANSINYSAPTDRSQDFKSVSGTIEVLSPLFEVGDDIKSSRHLDSFLSSSSTIVSKTTSDTDGTVAGLSDGSIYFLTNTTSSGTLNIDPDNQYFLVDGGQFKSVAGSAIDFGAVFTADTQIVSSTFTGLDIMLGKTIRVYADGRDLGTQVINPVVGVVTLDNGNYGANVTFGYDYTSYVELHNLEGNPQGGLDQGKTKKINKVMVRILNSLGLKYGDSASTLLEEDFDEQGSPSDYRDLKSGDYILDWDGDFEQSGTIRLQGDGPYPLQIQAVIADMDTKGYSSNR